MRTKQVGGQIACLIALFAAVPRADAGTAVLQPVKDNTLYQSVDGTLSNGFGQHIFAGQTIAAELRRALMKFDIAAVVPAGATITGATLVLNLSKAFPGGVNATADLHTVDTDWGEAASDAPGEEGIGTFPERDDATWIHTFYDGSLWTNPGGDFAAAVSASTVVGSTLGPYSWSGPGLVADVQAWLDTPASNNGWVLLSQEATPGSAKRFDSADNPFVPNRPRLIVDFTVAGVGSAKVPEQLSEGTPLRVNKLGANVQLTWGNSCLVSDVDYSVYEGALGIFPSHLPVVCTTGGSTSAVVTPAQNRAYYLVVPAGSGVDGSYGHRSGAIERPLGYAACRAQVVIPCP